LLTALERFFGKASGKDGKAASAAVQKPRLYSAVSAPRFLNNRGGNKMLKIYNDGKRVTAALSGDIDHHAAREFRTALDEIIARSRPELLILDMENVGFMDSSGIGLILGRLRSVRAAGGEILIKNARPEIAAVIKLSGLSSLIVEPKKQEAKL